MIEIPYFSGLVYKYKNRQGIVRGGVDFKKAEETKDRA